MSPVLINPLCGTIAVIAFAASSVIAQPSFTPLGDLPGGGFYSNGAAVSADGQVVVGSTQSTLGRQAFRWTRSGGLQGLGDFPPSGPYDSYGLAVSTAGDVVVGDGSTISPVSRAAFRWTASTGLQSMGTLTPFGSTYGRGVSADGSVVTGVASTTGPDHAFRWTAATGMQSLGSLGANSFSGSWGISADGSIIVGRSNGPNGAEAFRWTAATGMQGLGDLPNGGFWSEAHAVSGDGNVIIGFGENSAFRHEAARWTQAGGWSPLGFLPNDTRSAANASSYDGSLIGGTSGREAVPSTNLGILWDASHGMRYVKDVLLEAGIANLGSWTLTSVTGISADGLTICGAGINPAGQTEGWVATIPSPTSGSALGLALILLRRRRW